MTGTASLAIDTVAGTRLRVALLLAILAIVTRIQIYGNPIADTDEGFYLLVGERMLHGVLPYVGIWDRKPVGLFALYAAMRSLGGDGVLAYKLTGTVFAFLTALIVARIAERVSSKIGAAAAGAAYLFWLTLGAAFGGQAELFANLPIAAAALITLRGLERAPSPRLWLGGASAMLLAGIAMQIKYTALFAGFFFGCCWLVIAWRAGRRAGLLPLGALWVLAALAPTLAAAGYYAAEGHLDAFLYANFISVWQRSPSPKSLHNLTILGLILAPLLACVRPRAAVPLAGTIAHRFALGWLAAALGGLLLFHVWTMQFLLPVLMPASVAAAPLLASTARWRLGALLLVALVLGQAELAVTRLVTGSRSEARAITAKIDPHRCLFVYSGLSAFYRMSGACIPTRFAFPSHLSKLREGAAIGVDPAAEVDRIMRTRPATVILRSPYPIENWRARAVVLAYLRRDYHPVLETPLGWQRVGVFRLNEGRGESRLPLLRSATTKAGR